MISLEDVRERLGEIRPHGLPRDIVAAGLVRDVALRDGAVTVHFHPGPLPAPIVDATVADIKRAVGALPGVTAVEVQLVRAGEQALAAIPGVADIIAVSSTKGGVGKSTVAMNLACALQRRGLRSGVLDADVYGPSLPTMLGISDRPEVVGQSTVIPLEKFGLRVMSMGFFLDDTSPVVWRGPLVTGLVRQFLKDVRWGDLDYLLIDMPPGTGDIQMGLARMLPQAEMLVVTTPALAAQKVAARVADMARRSYMKVIGVVENMSEFVTPSGERFALFGEGGGASLAEQIGAPLVARVPLEPDVSRGGDAGRPVVLSDPESPAGSAFHSLAARVVEDLLPPVEMSGCTARILELAMTNLAASSGSSTPSNR